MTASKANSRPSFILTGAYEPDGKGGGKLWQALRKDDDMTIEDVHAEVGALRGDMVELAGTVGDLGKVLHSWGEVVKASAATCDMRHMQLEELAERVGYLKKNLGDRMARLDSSVDTAIGRLDVMDQVNSSLNGKIEEVSDKLNTLVEKIETNRVKRQAWSDEVNENLSSMQTVVQFSQGQAKKVEEMRGDVAMCKSAIRDLDSIRNSATRAANQVAGFEPRLSQIEEAIAALQTVRHHNDSPRSDGG